MEASSTSDVPPKRLPLKPGESYQITPQQYHQLWRAANMEGMAFMIPSPKFDDTPERARELKHLCQDFDELRELGLVIDVSEYYEDNVREAWNEIGRHVRFMVISLVGKLLFNESEKRPVN